MTVTESWNLSRLMCMYMYLREVHCWTIAAGKMWHLLGTECIVRAVHGHWKKAKRKDGIRLLMSCPKLACVTDQPESSSLFSACADVTHWSGKLHQTYSCNPTLWLIWSVISPVFHFNRCDCSAVTGLSDLIKINFRVKDLAEISSQIQASSVKTGGTNQSSSGRKYAAL